MKAFHGDFAPCLEEMGVQYVCGYWILGEFHDCLNPAISKVDAQKWLVMSRVHNSPPIIRRRCPQFRRNRQLFDSGTLNGKKCKIVGRNSSAILRNSSAILKTCSLEKKSSRNCFSSLFWVSSELLSGCAKLPQHEIDWNSWVWLWKKHKFQHSSLALLHSAASLKVSVWSFRFLTCLAAKIFIRVRHLWMGLACLASTPENSKRVNWTWTT